MTTKNTPTQPLKPQPDTAWPNATIISPTNLDTPEAIALALMMAGISRAPEQRRDMLDLFAECLRAANGDREAPGVRH